jgi:ATP-binding cassette subfamily B protein
MIPSWPAERAALAIEALAGPGRAKAHAGDTPAASAADGELDIVIRNAAAWFGFEAEPVEIAYGGFARFLGVGGPMLLRVSDGSIVAVDARGCVIGPDLERRRVAPDRVRSSLFAPEEEEARKRADGMLAACNVAGRRKERVRNAVATERLKQARLSGRCWQLHRTPGGSLRAHIRSAGLLPRVAALLAAHALEYGIWIAAWVMVAQGALSGRLDRGWLVGWALLLLTIVPLRAVATWLQGQTAIRAGGLLKERLLYGALRLDPDDMRRFGAGQLLGRVVETDAMESLALTGGSLALIATVELIVAAAAAAAVSSLLLVLLSAWMVLTAILLAAYWRRCSSWAAARLSMTDDLVERMIGHRTRLAQEAPEGWHSREDRALDAYQNMSRSLDAFAPWLTALLPRGWLILGIGAIAQAFVAGAMSPERLAACLGVALLAFRSFRKLGTGAPQLLQAAVAWRQAAPLFHAAEKQEENASPAYAIAATKRRENGAIVDMRNLTFRYRDRDEPVLRGCTLQIRAGERILLDGPSGGGKSTLASIVAGVRKPMSGLMLAGGLDRLSIGADAWRRRVAMAPQFHENHLITGSLAFNLLMGRPGPITEADLQEAAALCEELGLGGLLERMPAGIMQLVGEGGWQLSHGERSRVYLARALLQKADVVVLDESFAALDAVNLQRAIACVENRASAVLAIAHA